MKNLLLGLTLLASVSSFAGNTKSYQFSDAGEVRLSTLEEALSPGFGYADVRINFIRGRLSPFKKLGAILGFNYKRHVINITLDHKDEVGCVMVELVHDKKFLIADCQSKTSAVYHDGYILYEDVGVKLNRY